MAVEVVRVVAGEAHSDSTSDVAEMMVVAVEQDLAALNDRAAEDERRITDVETQTQLLAAAVIAIAATDKSVAPAVKAIKAILPRGGTPEKPDSPA
jgi:hypothetical protein